MKNTIREMLIVNLLGDASIRRTTSGKAFVTFEQSVKKSEYLNHLFNKYKELGLPLKKDQEVTYSRQDPRYDVTNSSLYFRSEATKDLTPIADLFLDESGKKKNSSHAC